MIVLHFMQEKIFIEHTNAKSRVYNLICKKNMLLSVRMARVYVHILLPPFHNKTMVSILVPD